MLGALNTARSPYNLSSLSQLLGRLLLEQQPCLGAFLGGQAQKLENQLRCILPGADVFSTCTNFVYLETADAQEIFEFLKEQGIIVRLFGTGAPVSYTHLDVYKRQIQPRKWDTGSIQKFMFSMGPLSCIFDLCCYAILWWAMGANTMEHAALFQCGNFVYGTLSQILVVHMILALIHI